jgi:hypothetical protein
MPISWSEAQALMSSIQRRAEGFLECKASLPDFAGNRSYSKKAGNFHSQEASVEIHDQ